MSYRGNALSYFVGLDAGYVGGRLSIENSQEHVISGDHNFVMNRQARSCSSGVKNAAEVQARSGNINNVQWTNSVHVYRGNLALVDGSVHATTTTELREFLKLADDNGNVHFLPDATPTVTGPEVVKNPINFEFVHATSDSSAITAVVKNGDSAP